MAVHEGAATLPSLVVCGRCAGEICVPQGRFTALEGLDTWGKDPMAAALALIEMVGPVVFSHWGANGDPVGRPHRNAYVTVSAVAESQTRTTSEIFQWMISDRLKADYGLNVGIERVSANGGMSQIVFAASSFRSIEGRRPTFSIMNEIQHWVAGNAGHQMYHTLNGNFTKSPGGVARMLAITNAYQPGEDSVGEVLRQAYLDQLEFEKKYPDKLVGGRIYYDSLEADPNAPLNPEVIPEVVSDIRGDSVWLDPESITASFLDRSIPVSHNRRMFYNQIVAKEDALYSEGEWDSGKTSGVELKPRDQIVLGFDGGKNDDSTALIAKRLSDGVVFPIMIWEKPPTHVETGWEIDRQQVDSYVHWAFKTFDVKAFYADVAYWESYVDQWSEAYRDRLLVKASPKSTVGWDMRGGLEKITRANEALMTAVFDGMFKHNGNRVLRRHALNARRRENRYGTSFGKESRESPLKVDAYAALLLAEMAYKDVRESGKAKGRSEPGSIVAY